MRTKILIICISCLAAVCLCLGVFVAKTDSSNQKPEVKYQQCNLSYNPDNKAEVAGNMAYVFIGYVNEMYDYYSQRDSHPFPALIDLLETPFTECTVSVVKNIKGSLKEGEEVSIYKMCGISKDGKDYWLLEDDLIPETGNYYVFSANANEYGMLMCSGPGTYALEKGINENNLDKSVVYGEAVEAYENQVVPKQYFRPDYIAKCDIKYKEGINEKISAEFEKARVLQEKYTDTADDVLLMKDLEAVSGMPVID